MATSRAPKTAKIDPRKCVPFSLRVAYTLARKYTKNVVFGINFSKNYISVTRNIFLELISPKIQYHGFVCDSENYMDKRFGNDFLGESHVSYMK